MYDEKLTPSERRSVIGLLFMIAIGGSIIFFIKIANDSEWGDNQWAGVSAIANWVEALAVVGALVFAGVQLRTSRESDTRRRYAELVDRLDVTVHEELDPAVELVTRAADAIRGWVEAKDNTELDPNELPTLALLTKDSQQRLKHALDQLDSSLMRTRRYAIPFRDDEVRRIIRDMEQIATLMTVVTWAEVGHQINLYCVSEKQCDGLRQGMKRMKEITVEHVESAGVSDRLS